MISVNEKYVYIRCEECNGEGRLMFAKLYPSGHTEVWESCNMCDGEGTIEILEDDYIIAKLKGSA